MDSEDNATETVPLQDDDNDKLDDEVGDGEEVCTCLATIGAASSHNVRRRSMRRFQPSSKAGFTRRAIKAAFVCGTPMHTAPTYVRPKAEFCGSLPAACAEQRDLREQTFLSASCEPRASLRCCAAHTSTCLNSHRIGRSDSVVCTRQKKKPGEFLLRYWLCLLVWRVAGVLQFTISYSARITYFKNEKDRKVLGHIELSGALSIDRKTGGKGNEFHITMKSTARVWMLVGFRGGRWGEGGVSKTTIKHNPTVCCQRRRT